MQPRIKILDSQLRISVPKIIKRDRDLALMKKRTNKKAKKSVDQSTFPEGLTKTGENPEDASANKDADTKKKEKRVLTAERKAKKKRKEKIKRAEKNRKLGVKRLKLQPVIKEKKIIYCRHYINGRCHEGENCKFSHDTTPLTNPSHVVILHAILV